MNSPGNHDAARVYDQGYRHWEGELGSMRSRFLVVAANELRQAWKEKWFRRVLLASFGPLIVFAVIVVVAARFQAVAGELQDVWRPFWSIQVFMAMLMVYLIGRGAVGEDLRTGALVVYFSRPVGFWQYLLGKWLAMGAGVLGVTLLPGALLALFRWLAEPETGAAAFALWLLALVILSLLLALVMGAIMLAVSSLTGRERAAGIVWVILFFVSFAAGQALSRASGLPELETLGFGRASERLAELMLSAGGSAREAFWPVAGQLAWAAAALAVVLLRLRRWVRT